MIGSQVIRQMPFAEKLALLEAVWSELILEPEKIEVPEWHKEILDQREADRVAGLDQPLDWEEAKRQIEKSIR